MAEPLWQLAPFAAADDGVLSAAVEARFREIRDGFAEPIGNPALPVLVQALRQQEDWHVFLLLAPWMLARVFLPRKAPTLPVPPGWSAEERAREPYCVIGPAVELAFASGTQKAHINYDLALGHYLIQPLVQAMEQFTDADAVFGAWNAVIATRDQVMREQQRDCPWQREVSRREFFTRLAGGRS